MKRRALDFGDALGLEVAYSNAISVDISESTRMVYISGQLAFDEDGKLVGEGDIRLQTEQCIKNIVSILEEFNGSLNDVVQVTVYVKDMSNLQDIHQVRLEYFTKPYPTSTLIQIIDFAFSEALIEIEARAIIDLSKVG